MSDILSIQVCSGIEQNRRHLQRSPCNPDIHLSRPDFPSHMESLYRGPVDAKTFDELSFRFQKDPVFNTGLQMQFITTYHIFGMGYTPHGPFPVNPNSERLFKNKCGIQIQTNHNKYLFKGKY